MNGAVELYKACAKHGVKPIVGCEIYLVDDHLAAGPGRIERNHLTLLAADDAGYRNLVKLSSAGFLEGLQRGKPTVDLAQVERYSRGGDRAHRLPGLALLPASARGPLRRMRAHMPTTCCGCSAPRTSTSRCRRTGWRRRTSATRASCGSPVKSEAAWWAPATSTTCAARTTSITRRSCACRPRARSPTPKMTFETNEFYLRDSGEMLAAFAEWPEAIASTVEIAERCSVELELGKQLIPSFQTPDGSAERDYLRARVLEGLRLRYGDPPPAEAIERHGDGARRDRPDGLQRLLPDRLGLREVRQGERHRRRARARLGGRLDRRLLPGDHRRGSAALRPPVRALPEPRARLDAGHRHRLLGARARAGDALRDREVRARVGRADRDVRQDVPARGHPRRGARAGLRLRHRRPAGEAHPRSDHGPRPVLRGVPEGRPAAAQGLRRGARRPQDRRRRPGARGHRAQLLDPRGGGRDRRGTAHRHRAAAARRRRHRRGRRADLPHGHAVLDEADRGHRPAQDGLPGAAQPRRDRGCARHHRALERRASGHDDAAARRRADV